MTLKTFDQIAFEVGFDRKIDQFGAAADEMHRLMIEAIEADRAQRNEDDAPPERTRDLPKYFAEDVPDWTPDTGEHCDDFNAAWGFQCTRAPGHAGKHAAGTGDVIAGVWA